MPLPPYISSLISYVIFFILGSLVVFPAAAQKKGADGLASELKKDYYLNRLHDPAVDLMDKIGLLDTLTGRVRLKEGELLCEKTDIYISTGHYNKASDALSPFIAKKNVTKDTLLFALYNLAYIHQALGKYEQSLDCIYRIKTTDKPDSLKSYDLYADFLLARIYRVAGQFHKSDSVLKAAKEEIPSTAADLLAQKTLEYKWLLERSSASLDAKKYEEALTTLKKTADYNMDKESASLVDMSMAELYQHIGEAAIAENYYHTFFKNSPSSINRLYALSNYCGFLVALKRYDEAIAVAREQIEFTDRNGVNHVKAALYENLAKALYGKGQYKEAFGAYDTFHTLVDSILYTVSPSITRDYESRINRHRNPVSSSSLPTWSLWLIIILSLCIIFLLTIMWRKRQDPESQKAPKDISFDSYQKKFDQVNREYVSLAMKFAEVSGVLDKMYDAAINPEKNEEERKLELTTLRQSYSANKSFWDTFMVGFERIHPDFILELRRRHPDLTKGELRMCSFMAMELSTKEIAQLTSRSTRTVDSIKYAIRKKMNVPEDMSLQEYLLKILNDTL